MMLGNAEVARVPDGRAPIHRLKSLDARQACREHSHFWQRAFSRRRFLQTAGAAGLFLGSGIWNRARAEKPEPSEPTPIPGGFQIEPGGQVYHLFGPGVFDPIDADRSAITDFNGHLGYAIVRGTGTGRNTNTGAESPLLFEVDLRFMQGVYVGEDGKHRFATFCLI